MKVFCITTGRSGSKYLSKVLECVDNASVYHEHQPYGHMPKLMLHAGTGHPDVVEFIERKINVIKSVKTEHYIETNHCFIKSFWNIVSSFSDVKVIHLSRDPYLVIKSFYLWNRIPGNQHWHLSPFASNNIVPYIVRDTAVNRLIWQTQEISERARLFSRRYSHIPVYLMDTEELNDLEKIDQMLQWLQIGYNNNKIKEIASNKEAFNISLDTTTEKNSIDFTREKYLEILQAYLFDYRSQNPSDLMQDTFVSNFQSPLIMTG